MISLSPVASRADARELIAQTPSDALAALLEGPQRHGHLTIAPLCLEIIWLLQACNHPVSRSSMRLAPLSPLASAQLIFIFCNLPAARQSAWQRSVPGEISLFDREAFAFQRGAVPLGEVPLLLRAIGEQFLAAMRTAPSGSGSAEGLPAKSSGIGWTATLHDLVASEYGWPGEQIRLAPLSQLFLVYYGAAARRDVQLSGMTLAARAILSDRAARRAEKQAA